MRNLSHYRLKKIFWNIFKNILTDAIHNAIIQIVQLIQIIQIGGRRRNMQTNFSGKQDVYLEIAERYKEYIKLGIIKNGEKLPSVRVLAGELSVNPNTVARAYSQLEEDGFIRALPKKGAFVIWNSENEENEPDKKNIIYALRDMGVSRSSLLKWIEEVYGENDQDK